MLCEGLAPPQSSSGVYHPAIPSEKRINPATNPTISPVVNPALLPGESGIIQLNISETENKLQQDISKSKSELQQDISATQNELIELISNPDKSNTLPRKKSSSKEIPVQQKLQSEPLRNNLPPRIQKSQLPLVPVTQPNLPPQIPPHLAMLRPGIHYVPVVATQQGILVPEFMASYPVNMAPHPVNMAPHPMLPPPPARMPLLPTRLPNSACRVPLYSPPPHIARLPTPPPPHTGAPVARLKPIPLVTDHTPATNNPYLKEEDNYEIVEISDMERDTGTPLWVSEMEADTSSISPSSAIRLVLGADRIGYFNFAAGLDSGKISRILDSLLSYLDLSYRTLLVPP